MGALTGPAPLVDAEAVSVLLTREPLVLRVDIPVDAAIVADAADRLRTLPTVTVLSGDPAMAPVELVAAVDVCLSTIADPPHPWVHAPVADVTAAVAAQPEPALALVALLRASAAAPSVWDAVAAEAAAYAMLLGSRPFRRWLADRPTRSTRAPDGPSVAVARQGGSLRVELDRPRAHNALDTDMRDRLVEAFTLAATDPTITEVELSGRGPSFCAGGDLTEFGTVDDPATSFAVRLTRHPGLAVHRVAPRTTVQLHGSCIGAGIEVAAFARRVVAAPSSTIRLPELAMGLVPGAGGTVSIPRRIGRHRTAWLALTGHALGADTALAWGLVDEVGDEPAGSRTRSDG
ncbi:MAG: enoyl-CoA hydratase/isomerase family protein [Acidimicrobiales bacterium]|nr:enoyl-CoA hydratase/isomerase family protein [Acidimicrobiales bacterium]